MNNTHFLLTTLTSSEPIAIIRRRDDPEHFIIAMENAVGEELCEDVVFKSWDDLGNHKREVTFGVNDEYNEKYLLTPIWEY